jgi:hypothetical protein
LLRKAGDAKQADAFQGGQQRETEKPAEKIAYIFIAG